MPAVIVITAGFGETGAAGKAIEQRLAERLRAAGGRMIGPIVPAFSAPREG